MLGKDDEEKEALAAQRALAQEGDDAGVGMGEIDDDVLLNLDAMYTALCFLSAMMLYQAICHCMEADDCAHDKYLLHAIACAGLSTILAAAHFVFTIGTSSYGPWAEHRNSDAAIAWEKYVEPGILILQWLTWVNTSVSLTFPQQVPLDHVDSPDLLHKFPYTHLGTGWLMIWSSCGLCTWMLRPALQPCANYLEGNYELWEKCGPPAGASSTLLVSIFLLSLVVLWNASHLCDEQRAVEENHDVCDFGTSWAMGISSVSVAYCIFMFLVGKWFSNVQQMVLPLFSLLLLFWWWLGVTIICVGPPFGNADPFSGFMGAWLAFGLSALWSAHLWGFVSLDDQQKIEVYKG